MAKLHVSLDGNSLGEFSLNKERTTIGRRPSNDIHIDNLVVSGDHAVIVTIVGDSFLEDLNSTNGTIVNKKSIKKHVLQHDDIIAFGKYQLRYENIAQQKTTVQQHGFENTAVMRPSVVKDSLPRAQDKNKQIEFKQSEIKTEGSSDNKTVLTSQNNLAVSAIPSAPVNAVPKVARLHMLTGSNSGHELVLNKALTSFGEPGVQVVVITKRPHGYFLSHVEGEKRPLVNGQKAGPQAYALVDRDVIDIIGMKMEFYLS
ncbi:MAG: FHA domain-containing protein [Bdellovibrio sp.]|nr:FHA domain-containing protein [Methylotenera sp.]